EMLFIIVHHVSELWMKLILHEIQSAIHDIQGGHFSSSFKKLARVSQVQTQLKDVWNVLDTLTPSDYIEFRDFLGQASGFQSYQKPLIAFALSYKTKPVMKIYEKDPELHKTNEKAYHAPSTYDISIQALAKAGRPS